MKYDEAKGIADQVMIMMKDHCHRIAIGGSIRRKKSVVKDVEIIAILDDDAREALQKMLAEYPIVRGNLQTGKAMQFIYSGISVDVFTATPDNWGLVLAMRTGDASFSHKVLARGWVARGYHSINGMLHDGVGPIATPEEHDLFMRAGVEWTEPEDRSYDMYDATWDEDDERAVRPSPHW